MTQTEAPEVPGAHAIVQLRGGNKAEDFGGGMREGMSAAGQEGNPGGTGGFRSPEGTRVASVNPNSSVAWDDAGEYSPEPSPPGSNPLARWVSIKRGSP